MANKIIYLAIGVSLLLATNLSASTINFNAVSGTTGITSATTVDYELVTKNGGSSPWATNGGLTGWWTGSGGHGNNSASLNTTTTTYTMTIDNTLTAGTTSSVTGAVLNLAVATALSLNTSWYSCSPSCSLNPIGDLILSSSLTPTTNVPTAASVARLVSVSIGGVVYTFPTPVTIGSSYTLDLLSLNSAYANLIKNGNDIILTWENAGATVSLNSTDPTTSYACKGCTVVYHVTGNVTSSFSTAYLAVNYRSAAASIGTPEPGSLALIGTGLLALPLLRRRRK